MKRFLVITSIMVILAAGIAWAADEAPTTPAPTSQPSASAEQPTDKPADAEAKPESTVETRKAKLHFGPVIGIYRPTSAKVQDTFGSNWTRLGIRPFLTEVPDRWRFMFDLAYYAMDDGTDRATLIPITAGFMKGISQRKDMLTYSALTLGPFYGNIDAPSVGVNKTGWGLNANATLGIVFKQRWSLEARYEFMNDFGGFDFSAFSIAAGLRLFDVSL